MAEGQSCRTGPAQPGAVATEVIPVSVLSVILGAQLKPNLLCFTSSQTPIFKNTSPFFKLGCVLQLMVYRLTADNAFS